jgi:hypothetical protein
MDQAALLDAYLGGPDRLRSAVTGLSREQMIARPITGRWSVLEVVCHLVDTDANIAHRIKRVLSEERPVFDRVKPELMLAALAYHDRDVEDELGIFDLTRRQIGRILRASPPEVPCERRFDFHPPRQQSLMIGCLGEPRATCRHSSAPSRCPRARSSSSCTATRRRSSYGEQATEPNGRTLRVHQRTGVEAGP